MKYYSVARTTDNQSTVNAILDHATARAAWWWLAKDRSVEERDNGVNRTTWPTWKLRLRAVAGRPGVLVAPFVGLEGQDVPQCVHAVLKA